MSRISYIAELKGKQGGRNSLSQPALCLQPPTAGRVRFSGRKGGVKALDLCIFSNGGGP